MTDVAVKAENLGKRYRIGIGRRTGQGMLRDSLTDALAKPFRVLSSRHSRARTESSRFQDNYVWALRNVSFDVPRGQVLGIIGPNGAGKSTLLKILSRITEPTEGRGELRGRVASLLEVGTGFHPELTGQENVYLSGALLGMKKTEIERKFDEIVAFAEIEKFIGTPVKHYSSGMYVRLAFAVAAHLEPEILIVDEVLAVGDVAFQRKCLSKMEDVRQHGRTVLFVSHNMAAVTRLCQRALLISEGGIQKDGPVAEVAGAYLLVSLKATAARAWPDVAHAPGDEIVRLRSVRIRTEDGTTAETVDIRRPVGVEMVFDVLKPGYALVPYYDLFNEGGLCIFTTQDLAPEWRRRPRPVGRFTTVAWIPANFLAEGAVVVNVGAYTMTADGHRDYFKEQDVVIFQVIDSAEGDAARGDWDGHWAGIVRPLLPWTTDFTTAADLRSDSLHIKQR